MQVRYRISDPCTPYDYSNPGRKASSGKDALQDVLTILETYDIVLLTDQIQ